ncbi:hypothetical protein [Celeribacter indicus]|uniref:Putative lipoprotein n=1 Tax=Celeribacter indicus TaxID=1208324 RepID=A0A0B5E1U7_9RHOB|nr:hypothetical protein [Celeribacter indicus]AJE46442.1 putative lipoprotein [Celeribacter indicus]SDW56806.1 hypothetical protein SAMN05443573_104283 [Celeribacter indicus]
MRRQVVISGLVLALLAGCATVRESRINPVNWFGPSEAVAVSDTGAAILPTLAPRRGYPHFVDTRPLAPAISDVSVSRSASGAIVTATASLPAAGYFDAELVRVPSAAPGTLSFEFRLRPPPGPARTGTAPQRQITAAASLSTAELAQAGTIVVIGAEGARQVRR